MFGIGNNYHTVSLGNCFVTGNTSDSYGGILSMDQDLVQLSKRRAGCIEEDTNVYIQNKGLVKIKDVEIGDYILSLDKETGKTEYKKINDKWIADIDLNDQCKITYTNGTVLRTSKKHPITTLIDDKIDYLSIENGLSENYIGIKRIIQKLIFIIIMKVYPILLGF